MTGLGWNWMTEYSRAVTRLTPLNVETHDVRPMVLNKAAIYAYARRRVVCKNAQAYQHESHYSQYSTHSQKHL